MDLLKSIEVIIGISGSRRPENSSLVHMGRGSIED